MGQEFGRDLEAGVLAGEDGRAELQRVAVDDDRGQQVEAGDPLRLSLLGSVSQFAALVEIDGALEGMMRLALVQSDLGAPAHVGVRGPVDHEQRAFDAAARAAGSSRCRKPWCGWLRPRWPTATRRCRNCAANSASGR